MRNLRSVSIVAAVYVMVGLGPDARYGELACYEGDKPPAVVAHFKDVKACVAERAGYYREGSHCECVYGQRNPIATYYYWLAVPVSFLAAASMVTHGPWRQQLLQLNTAIIGGGVVLIAYYIYLGRLYDLGVLFSLFFLGLLAVATSIGLVTLRFVGKWIRQ